MASLPVTKEVSLVFLPASFPSSCGVSKVKAVWPAEEQARAGGAASGFFLSVCFPGVAGSVSSDCC